MSKIKNIKSIIKKPLSPEEYGFLQIYNLQAQILHKQSSDKLTTTVSINVKNKNIDILYKKLYNGGTFIHRNEHILDDTKNIYFYSCGAAAGRGGDLSK